MQTIDPRWINRNLTNFAIGTSNVLCCEVWKMSQTDSLCSGTMEEGEGERSGKNPPPWYIHYVGYKPYNEVWHILQQLKLI